MWELYDRLISEIPEDITVEDYNAGSGWTMMSAGGNTGVAFTVKQITRPCTRTDALYGIPLREAAKLVKSWNFLEASLGQAAINSWYNSLEKASALPHFRIAENHEVDGQQKQKDGFDEAATELAGKKVAVIGHFPFIEKQLGGICELSILERAPSMGDFPDSACEYILPEQDCVFITGMTLINKTLPRLLEICRNQKIFMIGPSVPLTTILFDYGVYNISGFVCTNAEKLKEIIKRGVPMGVFQAGHMLRVNRDYCAGS
jgi:uncharacterized protein (DUF4213/DUF364 family)